MRLGRCWKSFAKLTRIFRSAIIARVQPASITEWSTKEEPENTRSILSNCRPGPVAELIRGGFVDPYRSPETDAVRPEFIDPRHLWNAYHYLVVGLAYNKNLVKSSEVPKTYQDLLLPRWRGRKMSLDRDAGDVFGALLDSWGEKEGIDYFHRLAKQEVLIRSGYTLQAQLLAAGEVEIVPWSHLQRPLLMADSGAPLGIGFLEPVVSKAQVLLLARRAAHPYAAALFIDWSLSEEGQAFVGIDIVRSPVTNRAEAEIHGTGPAENQGHHTGISRPKLHTLH